ncbi:MAG: serine/threonine protein kinase, partial [Verrucomicrobiae bacterium]|nr:serine/threonine protein kinase [Verrucomicrobiae bacterium]
MNTPSPGTDSNDGGFTPPGIEALQEALPQFEILELIGQGGMGAVYKARQPKLDRLVAIKILPAELTGDAEFAERFLIEARAMAKMKHSRIVTVHDFGETDDGLLYIVMEYVEGTDLARLIRDGSLSSEHVIPVLTQICDALNYAHRRQVVHRDIKPGNIMLDVEGQVK